MDAHSYLPSSSSDNMSRRCARRIERYCCTCVTYFPLAFVYGVTSWAVYVTIRIGGVYEKSAWIGHWSSLGAVILYLLLNWSYSTAVFTPPGSTTNNNGYSELPTQAPPRATSFTVKSNGETRFCKKCQARKPDRAHHCSTCRRCVLKMDHHCPWLATCIGLRNHKAFLLFLMYTTLFSLFCFAVSGSWVWTEIMNDTTYVDSLMPVQFIMLAVIAGIIALVVGAFTGWHIMLACRGQTTIECLEKTRYLSPLRKSLQNAYAAQHSGHGLPLPRYGQQLLDMHSNALPGITRPEEGEESRSPTPQYHPTPYADDGNSDSYSGNAPTTLSAEDQMGRRLTYDELERYRARKRYEEYLDEQDSTKLPNAFDLGARRNLRHLFGPSPWLWFLPVCNTTGDGWAWEASPRWLAARDRLRADRDEQRRREREAGWGGGDTPLPSPGYPRSQDGFAPAPAPSGGGGQAFLPVPSPEHGGGRRTPSKADRVLGRDPNLYVDAEPAGSVSMRRLSPHGRAVDEVDEEELDEFDDESSDEGVLAGERQAFHNASVGAAGDAEGGWERGGASGLFRKPSKPSLVRKGSDGGDEGVD